MPEFAHHWFYEFMTLLVVLDPIATVPLFMAVTVGLDRKQAAKVALYAVCTAFAILLFFIAFGQLLLEALNIPMASFQLAGSLLFLVLGIQMATGNLAESMEVQPSRDTLFARAVYPLAIPGIAGGGGILTVVLLTDNNTRTIGEQLSTALVLAACLCTHLLSFLGARQVFQWLGTAGIQVFSRVFGLILTSIAVNGIVTAIKISFGLSQ
jgi:multiple antibiotic resistance protein